MIILLDENSLNAVRQFFSKLWSERFFELYDDGQLHPVRVVKR